MSQIHKLKATWWLPGLRGRGNERGCCLMGIEFQFSKMKRVLYVNGGDGYTIV